MICETTESKISRVISERIPTIAMAQFRSPAQFDGGNQPHYGFFNTSTGDAIPSFTAKEGYHMTTHDDYVALASSALDAMDCEGVVKAHWTQTKSKAQATIIVCPTDEARRELFDIGGKDAIFPRMIIEAPFGRTFKARGGFYRDVCRNLDIPRLAGKGQGFETTIRHTAQLRSRMNEIVALCRSSCDFGQMVSKLNQLDTIEVSISEALAELYPMPENATPAAATRARNRAHAIYSRIHGEALKLDGSFRKDDKCSLWRLVSGVTGYVQHDKTRRKGTGDVDRAIMGLADAESNDVWAYASNMLSA